MHFNGQRHDSFRCAQREAAGLQEHRPFLRLTLSNQTDGILVSEDW
jgi:hypothetical protein